MSTAQKIMELVGEYGRACVAVCKQYPDSESLAIVENRRMELRAALQDVADTYEVMAIVHKNS